MIFQDVILLLAVCNLLNCQAIHSFHEEIPSTAQNLLKIPLDNNWQSWLEQGRKSRLSKTQMEKEINKSNALIKNHWFLENHTLKFDGKGHSIETKSVFRDFKLWLEWKIPPQGDLLILLRGVPGPRFWDYKKGPAEASTKGSGGLFLNKRFQPFPSKNADKPVSEWNQALIKMRGDRVSVWLNGPQVLEEVPLENSWDRRKPLPLEGPIGIQARGTSFEIKSMAIMLLEP